MHHSFKIVIVKPLVFTYLLFVSPKIALIILCKLLLLPLPLLLCRGCLVLRCLQARRLMC